MNYPSVTQVLARWTQYENVPELILQAAAERGTLVHSWCASAARGEFIPYPNGLQGYCQSFEGWKNIIQPKILLVETEMIHATYRYIGHPDLICEIDNVPSILDLKTPVAKQKTWRLQLTAYLELARNAYFGFELVEVRAGSLQLDPKGKIGKVIWYEESAEDFNVFLSALNVYRFFEGG